MGSLHVVTVTSFDYTPYVPLRDKVETSKRHLDFGKTLFFHEKFSYSTFVYIIRRTQGHRTVVAR